MSKPKVKLKVGRIAKTIQRLFFEYEKEDETTCISFSTPFIFRLTLKRHWGLQGSFHIRLLIFSFHIGLYGGLGWSISQGLEKWAWCLRIHLKRVFIAFIVGIPLLSVLVWWNKRLVRKSIGSWEKKIMKKICDQARQESQENRAL